MALLGNLVVRLGLDSAEFGRGLTNATKQLNTAGLAMSRLGSDLTKSVTVPIALAAGAVVKFGSDFEDAFTGVRKTVNATEPEFAKLRKGFREMALEIPLAVEELAGIGEAAGQLGIETENILGFTRVMADLGVTTNLSANEAATALARFANITGLSQTQFDRLGSAIVELGNNFATTEAEIVEFGLRLAGAGSAIGLTEAEILGFATALSSVGLEAQAGGTAFSRVFLEIQKQAAIGGEKLALFAQIAGQSTAAFRESFQRDAAGAITDFVEGLGRMDSQAGETVLALEALGITEIRLRDALLRASGAGDLFRESIQTGSRAFEENTALTKEAELRYKTFSSQLLLVKNALKDIGIELFDSLRPVLIDSVIPGLRLAVGALKSFAQAFAALPQPVQTATVAMLALVAAIGPIFVVGSKLIFTFKNLLVLFGQLTPAIVGTADASLRLAAAAAASQAKFGVLGAQAAAAAGKLSVLRAAAVASGSKLTITGAAAAASGTQFTIAGTAAATTGAKLGILGTASAKLGGAMGVLGTAFKAVIAVLGGTVAGLTAVVVAVAAGAIAVDKFARDGQLLSNAWEAVTGVVRAATDTISGLGRMLGEVLGKELAGTVKWVRENEAAIQKWTRNIADVLLLQIDLWIKALRFLAKAIAALNGMLGIKSDAIKKLEGTMATMPQASDRVAKSFETLTGRMQEAAQSGQIVGGAIEGLGVTVAQTTPQISSFAAEMSNGADSSVQLADGVKATLNPVATLANELASLAKDGFSPAQLAAAGYAEKAAVAVAEQMRINEAIGVTDAALPPLIAKLLELAQASKAAADWTAITAQSIQSLGIEASKVPATLENIIGPMTTLGTLTVKNADQFETFSKGAHIAKEELAKMEAGVRAAEQKVRDFIEAGATSEEILHAMGSEISSAAKLAEVLGVELDETTEALYRQIKGAEASSAASKQWQDAWSTAVGNIVSRFTKGVTDMIFEGKRMSFDLKDIFRDLAKSLLEILIGQLFSPLFKFVNQLGAQIGDWVGGLLGIPTSGASAGGGGGLGGLGGGKPTGFLAGLGAAGLGLGGSFGGGKLGGKIGGSTGATIGQILGGLGGMFLASKLGLFAGSAAAAGGAAAGGAGAAAGAGAGAAGGGLGLGAAGAGLAGAVKAAAVFLATNPIGWAILGGIGVFAAFKLARKSASEKTSSELSRDFTGLSAGKGDVKQMISQLGISEKTLGGIRKEISTLIALQQGFGAGASAQTQQAVFAALSRFQVSAAVGAKALAAGVKGQQVGQDIIFDLGAAVKQAFAGVTGPLIEQLSLILGGSQRFAQALPNFADIIAGLIGPGSQAEAAAEQLGSTGEQAKAAADQFTETANAAAGIGAQSQAFFEEMEAGFDGLRERLALGFEDSLERLGSLLDGWLDRLENRMGNIEPQTTAAGGSAQTLNVNVYGGDPKVVRDTVIDAFRNNTEGFTESSIYWQDKQKGAF